MTVSELITDLQSKIDYDPRVAGIEIKDSAENRINGSEIIPDDTTQLEPVPAYVRLT